MAAQCLMSLRPSPPHRLGIVIFGRRIPRPQEEKVQELIENLQSKRDCRVVNIRH